MRQICHDIKLLACQVFPISKRNKLRQESLINVIDFAIDDIDPQYYIVEQGRMEHLKTDLQTKAMRSISQMNLKYD